jgi:hypothetical protein
MIGSAAMSAVGAISQGEAQAQQQESAANAARYNAIIADQNAQTAQQAANANEEASRRKSAGDMGRLRASMAENGIGLDSGTATDLTENSSMNAELDALNIRYQGQQQARDYKSQAALGRAQAQQADNNASASRTAGYLTAGASALSSYGRYSNYQARVKNPQTPVY